jgi:hypothetical protein
MVEVRDRIGVVKSVVMQRIKTGHFLVDAEIIFVQLRKILELIAFSSLTANKEKYSLAHAQFATDGRAKDILKKLEKINPDFYPVPLRPPEASPDSIRHYKVIEDGFLTKEDFASLYDEASVLLHVPKPFSIHPKINTRYTPNEWVSRIQALLALHIVHLVDGKKWLVKIPESGPIHFVTVAPR